MRSKIVRSCAAPCAALHRQRNAGMCFWKRYAVAAVVAAGRAEGHLAALELGRDDLGDLLDAVVLRVVADVEGLAGDCLARSLQGAEDRLADVLDMHERAPGRSVAGHADLPGGVGPSGEIVEND